MKPVEEILYDYAMSMVGLPYNWGGNNPIDGFDCSGFVIELLQSIGMYPPKSDTTSGGLFEFFRSYQVQMPTFGTLLFFGKADISHVAMAMSPELMIEAGGGTSATVSREAAAKQAAFIRIRPISSRHDLLKLVMPAYPFSRRLAMNGHSPRI